MGTVLDELATSKCTSQTAIDLVVRHATDIKVELFGLHLLLDSRLLMYSTRPFQPAPWTEALAGSENSTVMHSLVRK